MARLTVWIIPMKRSVHVNHSRWPVLMERALISFGFAMGQTIAGINQTNRTAAHQQPHQVKHCVVYVVMFFRFFVAVCVFFFFLFVFHAWCVDTSCDGWYIIAITKENTCTSKKKNNNKNKLHSVWKLHSGKEILEYCKTWTRFQEQNEW